MQTDQIFLQNVYRYKFKELNLDFTSNTILAIRKTPSILAKNKVLIHWNNTSVHTSVIAMAKMN